MNETAIAAALVQLEAKMSALDMAIMTVWLIITGIGILTMQIGFALLETGIISTKNVKGTLMKNLSDNALGAVAWICFGWGLFYGNNGFASGSDATFLHNHDPAMYARIFQQFGFAAASTTLVSGAVIGRCRFSVYLVFAFLMSGIFYPIQAHWAWASNGWLYNLGFVDFAGGAVVHCFGASAALAGAIVCGPRYGRFHEDGVTGPSGGNGSVGQHSSSSFGSSGRQAIAWFVVQLQRGASKCCPRLLPVIGILTGDSDYLRRVRDMPEHSIVLYTLGGLFLYIGWFSFNAGSALFVTDPATSITASRAAINTLLASGSGTTFALFFCYLLRTRLDLGIIVNSMLTCTVVITPGAGFLDLWVALVAGPLSVVVYTFFRFIILHGLGIDDPLDTFAVHWGGGSVGLIIVGLLHPQKGLFFTGDAHFLGVEVLGIVVVSAFGFLASVAFFLISDKVVGIRYSKEDQLAGLDFMHFEIERQSDLDWINIQEYNVRERIKRENAARRAQSKTRLAGGGTISPSVDTSVASYSRKSNGSSPSGRADMSMTGFNSVEVVPVMDRGNGDVELGNGPALASANEQAARPF